MKKKQLTNFLLLNLLYLVLFFSLFLTFFPDRLWMAPLASLLFGFFIIGWSALDGAIERSPDQTIEVLRKVGILPRPTESGLFVMAITMLLVFTVYNLWPDIYRMMVSIDDGRAYIALGFVLVGTVLSIYHMFTDREKTEKEIGIMKFFMMVVLMGVSISTALFVYSEKQPGYLILTIWSATQALVLYLLANERWSHKTIAIDTAQATRKELYIALTVVPAVVIAAKLLNQHWVIAFSSALFLWSYAEIFLISRKHEDAKV